MLALSHVATRGAYGVGVVPRGTPAHRPTVGVVRPVRVSSKLAGGLGRIVLGRSSARPTRMVVKAAEDGMDSERTAEADGESGLAFEPKSKSKRKRRTGENTRRAKIQVEGMAIDAAKGVAPVTVQSASEEAFILFLLGYVVVIFIGGLLLAISAFNILPEKIDNWVEGTLYQAYTPTVLGFLGFSSIYGLIKTRDDPDSLK